MVTRVKLTLKLAGTERRRSSEGDRNRLEGERRNLGADHARQGEEKTCEARR